LQTVQSLYNKTKISDIQKNFPYVDWLSLFNDILPAEAQLQLTDTVVVKNFWFFKKLEFLLKKTSKRTLANHIAYHQVIISLNALPESLRKFWFKTVKKLSGAKVDRPRWSDCILVVSKYYPQAFGALFVRKFSKADSKAKVSEIVKNIKSELLMMLKDSSWITESTKQEAIKKAEQLLEQVGYSEDLLNDEKIVEYHKTFPAIINESSYYESIMNLRAALVSQNYKSLRKPVDKTDLRTQVAPLDVNAYYYLTENTIKITEAFINGDLFNADRPQYMNYGQIGSIIGHEIFHGE
jgi:predicted metalloendopeptidase